MTRPVSCSAASKACTCASAFCPVLPSMTSSTSCGAPGLRLADHAADLLQLLHQVRLRGQAPGGVGDDDVAAARLAGDDGVEGDAGRIAAFLADDLDAAAAAFAAARRIVRRARPRPQLLARRGAKGVGRGEQHLLVRIDEVARQLADARRLAGAVDADHHDHGRACARRSAAAARAAPAGRRCSRRAGACIAAGSRMCARVDAPLEIVEQVLGRLRRRRRPAAAPPRGPRTAHRRSSQPTKAWAMPEPVRRRPVLSLASQSLRSGSAGRRQRLMGSGTHAAMRRCSGSRPSSSGRRRRRRVDAASDAAAPAASCRRTARRRRHGASRARPWARFAGATRRGRARTGRVGGFFLKKLNMGTEAPRKSGGECSARGEAGRSPAAPVPDRLVILAGSGALAQSVRATES